MFDERQTDALKELCNIASGSAATVLSSFLKTDIRISVPRILAGDALAEQLGSSDENWVVIRHAVGGNIGGTLSVLVREADVPPLLRPLVGEAALVWNEDAMAGSAVREISNILTSYFLSVLGQFFRQVLVPGVPVLSLEDNNRLLSGIGREQSVLVETHFHDRAGETLWYLLLSPESDSLTDALETLLSKA